MPPLLAENLALGIVHMFPARHLLEEGPFREVEIRLDGRVEVVGKDEAHGIAEDLLEVEVDAARGAMVVDVGVHVETRVQEHDEGLDAAPVEGEALLAEERVDRKSVGEG